MKVLNTLKNNRALMLAVVIALLYIIFSLVFTERFFRVENFLLIILNMSVEIPIVLGICMLLLMREIDLSLGASMVLGAMLCGMFMLTMNLPLGLTLVLCVVIAAIVGLVNGLIVSYTKAPAFIATLAMSRIIMGIAIMVAGTGYSDYRDPVFQFLGTYRIFGYIQMPIIYTFGFALIFAVLTNRHSFFRRLYFIGGNAKSSELSGIKVNRTRIVVFVIAAVLASLCGIISAMRFNSSMTTVGAGVELRAVTACVVGGVSFTGGKGTIIGAIMGALLIASINNILTMFQINPDLQFVATGIILIMAILLDSAVQSKKIDRKELVVAE